MLRRQSSFLQLVVAAAVLCGSAVAFSTPPSDSVLPATTKGYLSIRDTVALEANWQKTMFGELARDESMKPFVNDLRQQLRRRVANIQGRVGLAIGDLKGIASGEVSLALVMPDERRAAVVMTADVAGRTDEAGELLGKIDANLTGQGATKETTTIRDVPITVYTLPPDEATHRQPKIATLLHDNLLCAADDPGVARDLVERLRGNGEGSLRQLEAYRATMDRCQEEALATSSDVRWFLEPFGYVKASRLAGRAPRKKRRGRDLAETLQRQGFDAIRGIGGHLSFAVDGEYELLHRTSIYAPPVGDAPAGEKYNLAMRMLDFPVGGDLSPQPWIPRGVATYSSFNWNVQKAFDNVSTLANEFLGPDGFENVIEGIEKNEFGPQVNFRDELIAHLGERVTVITDYAVPITTKSERFLFAVETTNAQALDTTIRKLMEADAHVMEREFQGHVVWEEIEEVDDLPSELDDEDLPFDPQFPPEEEDDSEDGEFSFPNSCICVANGQLLFTSNIEFMQEVLAEAEPRETLIQTADFNQIKAMLDDLASGALCLRSFSRTDEEYRPTYELLRQGKMPESETLLGRILNELLTDDDEELRKQRFDGSKLPNFEIVRRYFGPAGVAITPENDGWFVVGAMVRKDATLVFRQPASVTQRR